MSTQGGSHSYLAERQAAKGTGIPPFNSGNPPIQFAWIYACNSLLSGDEWGSSILFPQQWYDEIGTNQSVVGWTVITYIVNTAWITGYLFEELTAGLTVGEAVYNTTKAAVDAEVEVGIELVPGVVYDRIIEEGDLELFEDYAARIKTVYTGAIEEPVGWYLAN